MMMYIAMLAVGLVYLVLMIITRLHGPNWQAAVLKSFTSFFFLMTLGAAALTEGRHFQFALFVGGGLLLGLMGDIWLELKGLYPEDSESWTMVGFLVFLMGHFFYLAAVTSVTGLQMEACAAGLVGALAALAFIYIGEKPMHLQYGKFKAIFSIYGALLFFMAAYTVACAVLLRNLGLLVMGIGGALFLLSYMVLSMIYFGEEKKDRPAHLVINYVLYYMGQYLIASSVLWIGCGF
ncbi:MAG: lysoplasmalogenase [Lachnospiraceae bacterium]|nr:lysoplasmalogenase [Lachnospiraceae bacterium]